MQVVCGLFLKITSALLISNDIHVMVVDNHNVLGEVLGNRMTNFLMAFSVYTSYDIHIEHSFNRCNNL